MRVLTNYRCCLHSGFFQVYSISCFIECGRPSAAKECCKKGERFRRKGIRAVSSNLISKYKSVSCMKACYKTDNEFQRCDILFGHHVLPSSAEMESQGHAIDSTPTLTMGNRLLRRICGSATIGAEGAWSVSCFGGGGTNEACGSGANPSAALQRAVGAVSASTALAASTRAPPQYASRVAWERMVVPTLTRISEASSR